MTPDDRKKAGRWDRLLELLSSDSVRNSQLIHMSNLRRATLMLLASREELPPALTTQLNAYKRTLDALYLEAHGGYDDAEGVLNMIPAYIAGSLAGQLCWEDADDNDT